jgi:hypothetical protein
VTAAVFCSQPPHLSRRPARAAVFLRLTHPADGRALPLSNSFASKVPLSLECHNHVIAQQIERDNGPKGHGCTGASVTEENTKNFFSQNQLAEQTR